MQYNIPYLKLKYVYILIMNIEDFYLDDEILEWYIYNYNNDDLKTFIKNLKYVYKYDEDKISKIFNNDKQFYNYWNDIMLK